MARPQCSVFLCGEWGFKFRTMAGEDVILCEEHATMRGMSAGGASCDDPVPVREAVEVEAEIAAKLDKSPDSLVLDEWLPTARETPTTEETPMRAGKAVRRLDTGEKFESVSKAAESVNGSFAGLYEALNKGRPFKGVTFEYMGGSEAPPSPPTPPPPPQATPPCASPSIVKAKADNVQHIRRIEPANNLPPSVTSVFAAMSSMAAGMKGLKLTDVEITTDGVCIKAGTMELSAN
jgi:hypothetical protein